MHAQIKHSVAYLQDLISTLAGSYIANIYAKYTSQSND